jgi:hypothetical protein
MGNGASAQQETTRNQPSAQFGAHFQQPLLNQVHLACLFLSFVSGLESAPLISYAVCSG